MESRRAWARSEFHLVEARWKHSAKESGIMVVALLENPLTLGTRISPNLAPQESKPFRTLSAMPERNCA